MMKRGYVTANAFNFRGVLNTCWGWDQEKKARYRDAEWPDAEAVREHFLSTCQGAGMIERFGMPEICDVWIEDVPPPRSRVPLCPALVCQ